MLKPKFSISQMLGDCKSIIFTEETGVYSSINSGGYGSPNITTLQVSYVKLKAKFPNGKRYEIKSSYSPSQPNWLVNISDFYNKPVVSPVDSGCSDCQGMSLSDFIPDGILPHKCKDCDEEYESMGHFLDGCYEFTFEVYSTYGVPDFSCSYELTTKLCEGYTVEALVDGAWRDITNIGTLTGESYRFFIVNTPEIYTEWRIKNQDEEVDCGVFTGFNCTPTGYSERQSPAVVAAKSLIIPLTCNIESFISEKYLSLISESACDTKESKSSLLNSLMKFDLLKKYGHSGCDCACIESTIKDIQSNLKEHGYRS